MSDGSEMTATSEGNVNSSNVRVPDAVAYRLAVLRQLDRIPSMRRDDSYFEVVLSALSASNIATRALSRLCF